ncbi:TPA: hypothetical protein HA295_01060 [Candidatus Woesearchaeota archaeon]|nr:hypothetical protein [Candidatus Woesearchaeota archaeon]
MLAVGYVHLFRVDVPLLLQPPENQVGEMLVFRAVGGVVVVEPDKERPEIPRVLLEHIRDELLRGNAELLGLQLDGGAVGVVGAAVDDILSPQPEEPDIDVRLDVFHQVPDVDGAVGIGQGRGDDGSLSGRIWLGSEIAHHAKDKESRLKTFAIV